MKLYHIARITLVVGLATLILAAPKRKPKVLLIGDSIQIGYARAVKFFLRDVADVHTIPGNAGPTSRGLDSLAIWLGSEKWDAIHFNFGLHDLKRMRGKEYDTSGAQVCSPSCYRANLDSIVKKLQATHAKLIWASTTPVPKGAAGRIRGEDVEYNKVAQDVMRKNGVMVNDLYSVVLPHLKEYQHSANVHFNERGSVFLGRHVARALLQSLDMMERAAALEQEPVPEGVYNVYSCQRVAENVRVDGGLGDWDSLPLGSTAPEIVFEMSDEWQGATDCQFSFDSRHDSQFVYFAVRTIDDVVIADSGKAPWVQDGVEIRIDARRDSIRDANDGSGEGRDFLLVALSPGVPMLDTASLPKGTRAVCVRTMDGYSTEIAIPYSWFAQQRGGRSRAFRANVAVNDKDTKTGKVLSLWWKPDWRREPRYKGSGTFTIKN